MNNITLSGLLLYFSTVLLTACGGSGGGGAIAGIEGSGNGPPGTLEPITSAGAITATGSIFVNGIEYHLTGAAVTIDGDPATEADLDVGGIVIVEGELTGDGTTGTANRVSAGIAVAGPISAIDQAAQHLTVLGQSVVVDAATRIVGGDEAQPMGGLQVGDDREITGFADSTGTLLARRIAPRRASTPLRVAGYAGQVDVVHHRFAINGLAVDYSRAILTGFAGHDLAGAPIRVDADDVDAQGALLATDVVYREPGLPGNAGDLAALQGRITRLASSADFDVDGHPVVTTSATKVDGPLQDIASLIRLDAFIEVKGKLIGKGVVEATEVLLVNMVYRNFVVTDMNGDGQADVVAAGVYVDAQQNRVPAIYEFLDPPLSFPVDCEPGAIAVADLNNDGRADVIASCGEPDGVRLWLQKPSGGGQLLPSILVAMPASVGDLAIADVDGDGLPDVVGALFTFFPAIAFATQKAAAPGTFNTAVTVGAGFNRVLAADLNGDGFVDLATGGSGTPEALPLLIEYLQDPAVPGTFQERVVAACPTPVTRGCGLSTGQFTVTDVAGPPLVATGNFTARSCLNCPRPDGGWWAEIGSASQYKTPGLKYEGLTIADIDGDGRDDVVLLSKSLNQSLSFDVFLQTTPGGFVYDGRYAIPSDIPLEEPRQPNAIALADLDHDGLLDVAVSTGELFYFPQNPAARGKFGAPVRIGTP